MWVAGSTHEGEEAQCLEAQRELEATAVARGQPPPLLVLAPRRPERFAQVAQWLVAQHATSVRSTSGDAPGPRTSVLLVDRLGELLACYAAADVAFVGGTLVPVGGHNLLEPALMAKPVLAGPCTFNAPDAARLLEECGALRRVRDGASLARALQEILDDPALARDLGNRAAAAVAANRGAAARALAAVTGLAESAESRAPAAARAPSASG
jgi:3-deoxy-D-manno-octulosonic-acid transferase